MKIEYRSTRLSEANMQRLVVINDIIKMYQSQGYSLTLRQLYYQLVSRDIIPNKIQEYAKLSTLLKEGRMGGLVDWAAIEDRLRRPSSPSCWSSPAAILDVVASQFRVDRMEGQNTYIEVWVEKDALSGVLKRVTEKYGIPIVVNRGYSSATAMHDAHQRFEQHEEQYTKVIYIGDFDPSGQDMIRDIAERINEFSGHNYNFDIIPIALTWEQIQQYTPPPNPAKITDPRAKEYIKKHGATSWEVDALRPDVLNDILDKKIISLIDIYRYNLRLILEEKGKKQLNALKSKL